MDSNEKNERMERGREERVRGKKKGKARQKREKE